MNLKELELAKLTREKEISEIKIEILNKED